MIKESEISYREMERIINEGQVCAECNGGLVIKWGGYLGINEYLLACSQNVEHEGIAKPVYISPYNDPDNTLINTTKGRYKQMEEQLGKDTALALRQYEGLPIRQEKVATAIINTIWPKAVGPAVFKAIGICKDYGLDPRMNQLYLIDFKTKDGIKWAVVLGIKATRLMAARKKPFSYIDETPKVMTEAEQIRKFGKKFEDRIMFITKLRDKDGMEASGTGFWLLKDGQPYGADKGNSAENMASIRSERQAIDRLVPDMLPVDVDIMDDRYTSTEVKVETIEPGTDKGRTVDKTTGEITKEATKEEAGPPPEEVAATPSTEEEEGKPKELKIDMAWLNGELAILELNPELVNVWVAKTFNVYAGNELKDTLAKLNVKQQDAFTKQVNNGLPALRKGNGKAAAKA